MGQVPGATRALTVLRLLAAQPGPLAASAIARELGLPRSTTYHLLTAMAEQGFVTHLAEERRWGLDAAAFEIGTAYLRHRPLERHARPLVARRLGETAHLSVLHGHDIMYVIKEQPRRPATLISEVGVRLPAHLTASGMALLADLPRAQVRALFPDGGAFVDRTGRGPDSPARLRDALAEVRARGWAWEDEYVTEGYASVAAASFDHNGLPAAAIGVTFPRAKRPPETWAGPAGEVTATAAALTRRIHGTHP